MAVEMYIYDLPHGANKEICRLLDYSGDWRDLAGLYMGFRPFEVEEIWNEARVQGTSPSRIVLIKWGEMNHKVQELFCLLARMRNLTAMNILKEYVDPKYHKLLSQNGMDWIIERERMKAMQSGHQVVSTTEGRLERAMGSASLYDIPLPIQYIEQGVKMKSSNGQNGTASTTDNNHCTTNGDSSSSRSDPYTRLRDSASAIPMVDYQELEQATNNWSSSNVLGQGGFGMVFKGVWKNTPVAIKRLNNANASLVEESSLTELRSLNSCRHDNVLPLYGYSVGGFPCLVYQLMVGGSLYQRLKCSNGKLPLKWRERISIAKDVACGLQFLHATSGAPLIHGDIKSPNILLDACNKAIIGDFGLARRGPQNNQTHLMVSRVHGTLPYLPDEYVRSRCLSPAVDTYSFGVVLFELATALSVYDKSRPKSLRFLKDYVTELSAQDKDLTSLEDNKLRGTTDSCISSCRRIIGIGISCTRLLPKQRPSMENVFQNLSRLL